MVLANRRLEAVQALPQADAQGPAPHAEVRDQSSARSAAAARVGSGAAEIPRDTGTRIEAGSSPSAGPSSDALAPWAPTPGSKKTDRGISSRSLPRRSGALAPITAPIPDSPSAPSRRRS